MTPAIETPHRNRLVGGLILIGIGLYLLAAQFFRAQWMGLTILPVLSAIFIVAGLLTRNPGLLVPGGILGGIGLGTYFTSVVLIDSPGVLMGAAFLLSFAAGWALITVLSLLIGKLQLWPLIPGGIIAAVGLALLAGNTGLQLLEFVGRWWPLALVAGGLVMLWRGFRRQS
jgi:hypothetical protein